MSPHTQSPQGGFTIRRWFPASADRICAAFMEPGKLEQWFVVPGYRTPADRMTVDARPGGRVDAVMVADLDGSEIPFSFEYGDLAPPSLVTLRFDEPRELVTVTLEDDDRGGVELSYQLVSRPSPPRHHLAGPGGLVTPDPSCGSHPAIAWSRRGSG
jgi:uncharacterized protein YndB with AHSA1/START domain